jgi:serine/threonine protein kinase
MRADYEKGVEYMTGDIARLYLHPSANIIFKAANQAKDNDLMLIEDATIKTVRIGVTNETYRDCIPRIAETFLFEGRRVNVIEAFPGYYDGEYIHERMAIDGRTLAWMWKRIVALLNWVHSTGVIHGAVLPPHIMFFPDNTRVSNKDPRKHSIKLVDWCYAVRPNRVNQLSAWCPAYRDFYPPEVLARTFVGPNTDMYMAAKCLLYLAGGDVKTNTFPSEIPFRIVSHLSEFLRLDISTRPDPQSYHGKFHNVLEEVYGAPSFHEFNLPR